MRFIHTADWHLGKLFYGHHLLSLQRKALAHFIQECKSFCPDFILLAGDIYDKSIPSCEAMQLLEDTLYQLVGCLNIPLIMISGNHDSARRLGFAAKLLEKQGLYIVSSWRKDPIVIKTKSRDVSIYPLPYLDPREVEGLFSEPCHDNYQEALSMCLKQWNLTSDPNWKVFLGHLFVRGGCSSDSEAILSIGGVEQVSAKCFGAFDYVALGHLHRPQHLKPDPIFYPGSLLKYSFSEAKHTKLFYRVEISNEGKLFVKESIIPIIVDVCVLKGSFEKITSEYSGKICNDYMKIILDDGPVTLYKRQILLQLFPNLVYLSSSLVSAVGKAQLDQEIKENFIQDTQNLKGLFGSFFIQQAGRTLTQDELAIIEDHFAQVAILSRKE